MQAEGENGSRHRHLQRAQHENVAPHGDEFLRFEFKTDDEEKQDDAEFGDVGNGRGFAYQSEAGRADRHSSDEIADDRAKLQKAEQGHGHDGGCKKNEDGHEHAAGRGVFGHGGSGGRRGE